MPLLRRLHLCLGCFFAPMLVFFTLSGLWQMQHPVGKGGAWLAVQLSTIHTGRSLKADVLPSLSSPALRVLVVAMAVSLVVNVMLGLALAFRSSHRRVAAWSLFAGAVAPATLVIFVLWRAAQNLPGH